MIGTPIDRRRALEKMSDREFWVFDHPGGVYQLVMAGGRAVDKDTWRHPLANQKLRDTEATP